VRQEAAERRDDATASPPCHTLASLAGVGDRRTVEDDEELASISCRA